MTIAKEKVIDYEKIANLESFNKLVKRKNSFLFTLTFMFLAIYISLPILTSFTTILHQKAIGEITWVWLYAAGIFAMTIILATIYVRKAASFDKEVSAILAEYEAMTK